MRISGIEWTPPSYIMSFWGRNTATITIKAELAAQIGTRIHTLCILLYSYVFIKNTKCTIRGIGDVKNSNAEA